MFKAWHSIKRIWCFVAENSDGEGLVGMQVNGSWMPFVCADELRVQQLKPHAEAIAQKSGITVKLIMFDSRTEIESYPGKPI